MRGGFTDYQAKYYAHELQRSYASDHVGKLAGLLFDAQVEPKPHQIDAALFALQTPFLKGVILADEVGLGKTIEAGIVISQYWAERKRNILIVTPSSTPAAAVGPSSAPQPNATTASAHQPSSTNARTSSRWVSPSSRRMCRPEFYATGTGTKGSWLNYRYTPARILKDFAGRTDAAA